MKHLKYSKPNRVNQYWVSHTLFVLSALVILTLIGCSKSSTTLGLIGSTQTLPMPSFYAIDKSASGNLPRYAQIRVYEITSDCSLTNCPIIWDVVVSEKHAPDEFVYGGFPGFGAQTVIAAQPLKPKSHYLLVTLPDIFGSQSGHGQLYFRVTEEGHVVEE